jgi:glycosyltransferase involved in cell wall biosynthesis
MTEDRAPLVSVGLPVYNGGKYVARALDSLLAQDLTDFEIIICDNGSQDDTVEICSRYAARDSRIRLHQNPQNLGLVKNFNRTFELARGKYFKWVAHDDWHAPDSLGRSVGLLESHPDAVACATGVSIVDANGDEYDQWIPSVDLATPDNALRFHRMIWMLGWPHLLFGLLRSRALTQTSLMQSYLGSDRTLLAELSLLGPIVHTPEILHFYTLDNAGRPDYRPSLHYDPKNRQALPLRTWRLIYKHLAVVARSDLSYRRKLLLVGSVLGRFGVRDFRRLAAETYHSGRIITVRAVHWRPQRAG